MDRERDNFISFPTVYGVNFYSLGKKIIYKTKEGCIFHKTSNFGTFFFYAKYVIKSFLVLGQIFDWEVIQVELKK